jgi:hypothetical protein
MIDKDNFVLRRTLLQGKRGASCRLIAGTSVA